MLLLVCLARGDTEAWLFFGLIVAALVTFTVGPELVERTRSSLQQWWGVLIATALLGGVAVGLYGLHRLSPEVFALTEIAFSLVGIGDAVHALARDSSDWAALVVAVYGLHEGIGRLVDARKIEANPAANKPARAKEPSASPTK